MPFFLILMIAGIALVGAIAWFRFNRRRASRGAVTDSAKIDQIRAQHEADIAWEKLQGDVSAIFRGTVGPPGPGS